MTLDRPGGEHEAGSDIYDPVRVIATREDADSISGIIEAFAADMWAVDDATGRVDWEDWADRFERHHPDVDLGSDMMAPGFRRVQSIARQAIREARGE